MNFFAVSEKLAMEVDDSHGCYFVPAFSGLFCPYWQPDARGQVFTRKIVEVNLDPNRVIPSKGESIGLLYSGYKTAFPPAMIIYRFFAVLFLFFCCKCHEKL